MDSSFSGADFQTASLGSGGTAVVRRTIQVDRLTAPTALKKRFPESQGDYWTSSLAELKSWLHGSVFPARLVRYHAVQWRQWRQGPGRWEELELDFADMLVADNSLG
jgi:hypothetical protein